MSSNCPTYVQLEHFSTVIPGLYPPNCAVAPTSPSIGGFWVTHESGFVVRSTWLNLLFGASSSQKIHVDPNRVPLIWSLPINPVGYAVLQCFLLASRKLNSSELPRASRGSELVVKPRYKSKRSLSTWHGLTSKKTGGLGLLFQKQRALKIVYMHLRTTKAKNGRKPQV